MEPTEEPDAILLETKIPTPQELELLQAQSSRLVPQHKAKMLEVNAKKHWDLFYKRNQTKFFKDRHWTTREFTELTSKTEGENTKRVFLEIGCGVGNLIFPLIQDGLVDFYFYMCDISPRAIELVKSNSLYDESLVKAFVSDVASDNECPMIDGELVNAIDVVSLVFVLSAIHPERWGRCAERVSRCLRPGGALIFRDYGRYDMAQLRFKPGHKISDNLYMRQDGTRSYFFELEELKTIFTDAGLAAEEVGYVQRRTVNVKEGLDVPRIFLQGRFRKPLVT